MSDSIMSGNAGFTCTPMVYENPDGSTYVDYGDANIEDNSWRQQAVEAANNGQEDLFAEDSEGTVSHFYDIEDSEQYSDDWEPEYEAEELTELWPQEDIDTMLSNQGLNAQSYAVLTDWADDNLPESVVDTFNEIVDAGDWEEISDAIEYLVGLYENGSESGDDYSEEDYEANLETAYNLMEQASMHLDNPLAATALQYTAQAVRGEIDFEDAVGAVASEFGEDDAYAIFSEIINAYDLD